MEIFFPEMVLKFVLTFYCGILYFASTNIWYKNNKKLLLQIRMLVNILKTMFVYKFYKLMVFDAADKHNVENSTISCF